MVDVRDAPRGVHVKYRDDLGAPPHGVAPGDFLVPWEMRRKSKNQETTDKQALF